MTWAHGFLADAGEQPPPNAPEFGGSSPVGLVVIIVLFVATFLLVRSMNTHLRKVPASFDPPEPAADGTTADDRSADGEAGGAGSSGPGADGDPKPPAPQ